MPGFMDNQRSARAATRRLIDPRVRHFYDPFPSHLAGKAFAKGLIAEGNGPAWDIYFFYKKGTQWSDGPPQPDRWMHQLGGGGRADAKRFKTGQDLIDGLHQAMHDLTGDQCAP